MIPIDRRKFLGAGAGGMDLLGLAGPSGIGAPISEQRYPPWGF